MPCGTRAPDGRSRGALLWLLVALPWLAATGAPRPPSQGEAPRVVVSVLWRVHPDHLARCSRARAVQRRLHREIPSLRRRLRRDNVLLVFVEEVSRRVDPAESNHILVDGRPLATWLAEVRSSTAPCVECSEALGTTTSCRILRVGAALVEGLPRGLLARAVRAAVEATERRAAET